MEKISPFLTATATAAFASTRLHTLGLQPRPSRPVFESRERAIYSTYCADSRQCIREHPPTWVATLVMLCNDVILLFNIAFTFLLWKLRRSMRMTSTGARLSLWTALKPPKPPPKTITRWVGPWWSPPSHAKSE